MNSIQILVDEHDNILRMLDVIRKTSINILEGGEINIKDFKSIIDFVRKYADKAHHGKEEEFLFKKMVSDLGSVGENLISYGMLVEHDIGRLYVSDLDAALDAYEKNNTTEGKRAILVAAGSYEQLLRRHIQKENEVVFPFGEKKLSQESLKWVEDNTRRFEEDINNTKEREKQLAILELLEKKNVR